MDDLAFYDRLSEALAAPAAQALRVYCYLGESGLELVNKELIDITNKRTIDDAIHYLKEISREELERIVISIETKISLEENDYFLLPNSSLDASLKKIWSEPTGKTQKGRALEELCQLLFGSIRGFKYTLRARSHLLEADGVIQNTSKNTLLSELGSPITVEAKEYFDRKKIGRPIIDIIIMNMIRLNAKSAFLVTTGKLAETAKEELYHNYIRTGGMIIPLFYDDLKSLSEGRITFPILISKKISDIKFYRRSNT